MKLQQLTSPCLLTGNSKNSERYGEQYIRKQCGWYWPAMDAPAKNAGNSQ